MQYPNDLAPLDQLDDWKIADGETDPRGMELMGRGNQRLGKVVTLLASPTTEKAHFAIVEPDSQRGKRFAIPLDNVRFDKSKRQAYVPYAATSFADAPQYNAGARDYDAYNTYWVAVLKREPAQASDRHEQHASADDTLKLRREVLGTNKQTVEAGEVTVRKDVVTENKNIEVPVMREEVVIERHAVPEGTVSDGQIGADGEVIRVPLHEEKVNVDKKTVVTEEINVGKRQVEDTRTVNAQVRREEARIDTEGEVKVKDDRK